MTETVHHTVVLASNNAGKLMEFRAMLAPLGFALHTQGELNVPESPEPHLTFIENALEKARHAARLTGLPALADDSGICVNALGGATGRTFGALRRRTEIGCTQQSTFDCRAGSAR